MERETIIDAEEGRQEIFIRRQFDLPLELLFKAYTEPELVEQWMNTKVLKLENKKHGGYRFETKDPTGGLHYFNGTVHDFIQDQKIVRTFEMEQTSFPVQLEFLEFTTISEERSQLTMQIVYRSVEDRDNMLKLPFAKGINMAHNRLQEIFHHLNKPS